MNDTHELPDGDGHWMREADKVDPAYEIIVRDSRFAGFINYTFSNELVYGGFGRLPTGNWRRATAEKPVPREQSVRCFKGSAGFYAVHDEYELMPFFNLVTRQIQWCRSGWNCLTELPYASALAELASWPEGAAELRRLAGESTIADDLVSGLSDFADKLKSGEPIKATRIERTDTPDGPMHTRREVELSVAPPITYSGQELEAGVWAELYEDGSGADYIELPNNSNHGELKIGRRYIRVGDVPVFGEGE